LTEPSQEIGRPAFVGFYGGSLSGLGIKRYTLGVDGQPHECDSPALVHFPIVSIDPFTKGSVHGGRAHSTRQDHLEAKEQQGHRCNHDWPIGTHRGG
jgi:hypothetical protein